MTARTLANLLRKAYFAAYIKHNTHHTDPRWRHPDFLNLDVLLKIAEELLPCLPSPSPSAVPSSTPSASSSAAASSTSPRRKRPRSPGPSHSLFPNDPGT